MAIDFEDAFKSTNSKCCNLFFKAMNMNITVAPLCSALDEVLEGIYTPDWVHHKIKAFADDVKYCCRIKSIYIS